MQDKSCPSETTDDDCSYVYLKVSVITQCITSSGKCCCLRSIDMCQIAKVRVTADRGKPELLFELALYTEIATCCWLF